MSEWYEAKDEDIDLDDGEVNIYVTHNDNGSIYVTLTYEQVKNIYGRVIIDEPIISI